MAEIGRKGFNALVNRYFGGDAGAAKDWLHLQAAERKIDSLVSEKLASGEETCVELPVLLDPEDDPTCVEPPSWRDRVKASRRKAVEEVDLPYLGRPPLGRVPLGFRASHPLRGHFAR